MSDEVRTIVGKEEASPVPSQGGVKNSLFFGEGGDEADCLRFSLDGVLHQIDEDLAQQVFVGLKDKVRGEVIVPLQIGIERSNPIGELQHVYIGHNWLL